MAHGHVLTTELRDHFGMLDNDVDISITLDQLRVSHLDLLDSFAERFRELADVLLSVQGRVLLEVQDIR